MQEDQIIQSLKSMVQNDKTPAEMLRYLVLDLKIEQQLELMMLFTKAFNVTLGEVTAIGGWWHDDTAELNDNDINAYISPLIKGYLKS
jgi:hypothetical protein